MAEYRLPPDIVAVIAKLRERVANLENTQLPPKYTAATLPAASTVTGLIVYVSDGAVGSKFQGSNGVGWVSLG